MDKSQNSTSLKSSFLGSTPHPSSPISVAATSTSPRLSSFGRRFRAPQFPVTSIAPANQAAIQARNAEAVKSAKRFLLATIRSDWDYDPASPPTPPEIASPSRFEEVDYRRREDGSSDPGTGPEDTRDPMAWTDGELDPYRYESPNAVAAAVQQKKRKRQRLLEEEIQYNEGLRIFQERRNAWTGAVQKKPKPKSATSSRPGTAPKKTHKHRESLNMHFDFEADHSTPGSRSASPHRASSNHSNNNLDDDPEYGSDSASYTTSAVDPLLPLAPPLLPVSNPVRSAITPSMYPTIYSKVVIQSLTPSVPIPLPDITRAMIQGWKEEGNWPPKSTITINDGKNVRGASRRDEIMTLGLGIGEKEAARRDGKVRKGVTGAFRKALGLKHSETSKTSATFGNGVAGQGHGHGMSVGHHAQEYSRSGGTGGDSMGTMTQEDADGMFEEG